MVLDNRLSTQVPKLEPGGPSDDRWSQGGEPGRRPEERPERIQGAATPSGRAGRLADGCPPEISDGLMDPRAEFLELGGQPMHSTCPTMSIEVVVTRN